MLIRVTNHKSGHKSGYSMFDWPRKMLNKHYDVKAAGGMIHVKQVRIDQSKKSAMERAVLWLLRVVR